MCDYLMKWRLYWLLLYTFLTNNKSSNHLFLWINSISNTLKRNATTDLINTSEQSVLKTIICTQHFQSLSIWYKHLSTNNDRAKKATNTNSTIQFTSINVKVTATVLAQVHEWPNKTCLIFYIRIHSSLWVCQFHLKCNDWVINHHLFALMRFSYCVRSFHVSLNVMTGYIAYHNICTYEVSHLYVWTRVFCNYMIEWIPSNNTCTYKAFLQCVYIHVLCR